MASVTTVRNRFDLGALLAALLIVFTWHLANDLPASLRFGRPEAGLLLWLAYTVLAVIAAWVILRGGGQGPLMPAVMVPLLLAGVVANALVAPPSESHVLAANWWFASSSWVALIALWRRSLPEIVGFGVVNTLVAFGLVVAYGQVDAAELGRLLVLGHGVCIIPIALFVGCRMLVDVGRGTASDQAAQARTATLRLAAESVRTARARRYQMVQETVSELLGEIAAGRIDLREPEPQQRIRIAVARLRRLMVETDDVPEALIHELRACADAAERRGVEVDLQAPVGSVPGLLLAERRALTEPIITVLAATETHARVTTVSSRAEVVVAVIADAGIPPPGAADHGTVQVSYDTEGDLLWAQARWTAPSPPPSSRTSTWWWRAYAPGSPPTRAGG
ncbi:hypothetical protein Aph01nite_05580 [Acrocarpospora phusangensis]|uniref:Uncharacterized protein n=1 Tax=Acrocarpospora phusangensis TaxID=1070424 RepID=A0A919ULF3_9ACTN|nr:hypothetical protein [Acrocarpospora phusangensis]GIH22248.1 hypothetical protein Aph01nite_05580 [Acrocarpospora phusangensis]